MPAIVSLAAVVVDCGQAAPLAAFYQAAFGGEIVRAGEVQCIPQIVLARLGRGP